MKWSSKRIVCVWKRAFNFLTLKKRWRKREKQKPFFLRKKQTGDSHFEFPDVFVISMSNTVLFRERKRKKVTDSSWTILSQLRRSSFFLKEKRKDGDSSFFVYEKGETLSVFYVFENMTNFEKNHRSGIDTSFCWYGKNSSSFLLCNIKRIKKISVSSVITK